MIKYTNKSFLIVGHTLCILKKEADISMNILSKLRRIINIELKGEELFCSELMKILDKDEFIEFKDIIVRYANTEWFKPRGYVHFTKKINKYYKGSNKIDIAKYNHLLKEVSDPNIVAKHAFYPLIHYVLTERKFIKNEKKHGVKIKNRHINFATHIDSHIHSYYSKVLIGYEYEKYLQSTEYNDCVIAYRKIFKKNDANNEKRYKSNIDFANEVFDYVSKQNSCAVITIDIMKFFDNINHAKLYEAWTGLLKTERLSQSDYNIFKAITNFSYVDEKDLINEFNINNKRELKRKSIDCYCNTPREFRERIVKKGLVKRCICEDKENSLGCIRRSRKDRLKGIPQGTALSALLSNIYLLKFDEYLYEYIKSYDTSLYRRYSDDIIVVCPLDKYCDMIRDIKEKINDDFYLEIHPDKTQVNFFKKSDNYGSVTDLSNRNSQIEYLGFDFNGKVVSIKNKALAKFYRKMKKDVKRTAHRAGMMSEIEYEKGARYRLAARKNKFKGKGVFKKKLYRRYSLMSKANFLGYASRSSRIINLNNNINKQTSKSWNNLQKEISKYRYYEDRTEDNTINFNFF